MLLSNINKCLNFFDNNNNNIPQGSDTIKAATPI